MSSELQHAVKQFFTQGADRDVANRETAEANHKAALDAHPWLGMKEMSDRVSRVVEENASRRSRLGKLRALVDEAAAAVAPFTPCGKGCSYCCHIPVLVFAGEAATIASAIGRPAAKLPLRTPETIDRDAHMGEPCPFLVDNACSIYEVRPLTCRLHHSLDASADQCNLEVPCEESSVPTVASFRWIELGYASLVYREEAVGDIRDFFPPTCEK